jgi:ribose/xylose/arabinose/galactoside ABC-type transport system permease subunit
MGGYKAAKLFQARGWAAIINDPIITRSLGMSVNLVAFLTGLVAVAVNSSNPLWLNVPEGTIAASLVPFSMGFIYGLIISLVLLTTLASAVDTIMVCFAETPNNLQVHHPNLSANWKNAWRSTYPSQCGF